MQMEFLNKYQRFLRFGTDIDIKTGITKVGRKSVKNKHIHYIAILGKYCLRQSVQQHIPDFHQQDHSTTIAIQRASPRMTPIMYSG
jgi:hypothetical protein